MSGRDLEAQRFEDRIALLGKKTGKDIVAIAMSASGLIHESTQP